MSIESSIPISPIEEWLASFHEQPAEALDRLLLGRAFLGQLERNDPDEILYRLFHLAKDQDRKTLDEAMCCWLTEVLPQPPHTVSATRWAETLQNAFSTVVRLQLPKAQDYLFKDHKRIRVWLRGLYQGPARDPEGDFMRALALGQHNRDLLPLWISLCRLEEDGPADHAAIGLLGLQKLPEENGTAPGDLPPAIFGAIRDLANVIDKRSVSSKEGEVVWFRKVRAIMARYPRSDIYWTEHFFPLVSHDPDCAAARGLGKLLPRIKKMLQNPTTGPRGIKNRVFSPPSYNEFGQIRDVLQSRPLQEIRPRLETFLQAHERYTRQTGDAELLAKVFPEVAYKIRKSDPELARSIIKKAFFWAPYDPRIWTQRAMIESSCGRQDRAAQLLWEAKRKFPENPYMRTQLGEVLRKQSRYWVAEAVYRQAMEDFPQNDVCRTGLAEVLKAQERYPEAEAVYRQTMKDFPQDDVCRNGLAEVLKTQEKYPEAEAVYRQTMKNFPQDVVCRNGLAEVLKTQEKYPEAEAVYRQTMKNFPQDVVCRNGLAEILKAQERYPEAEAVYRQAMKNFPQNSACRVGLSVVLLLKDQRESAILLLEETVRLFPADQYSRGLLQKVHQDGIDLETAKAGYKRFYQEMEQAATQLSPAFPSIVDDEALNDDLSNCGAGESRVELPPAATDAPAPVMADVSSVQPTGEPASICVCSPLLDNERDDEAMLGEASLFRLVARRAEGHAREQYRHKFVEACEKVLGQSPSNIFALMEKGFGMVDMEPGEAEAFFREQISGAKRSHVLGFCLGLVQAKIRQEKPVATDEWKEIADEFSTRKTLILFEKTLYELMHPNGTTLQTLEALRRQIRTDLDPVPKVLQENEKWLRSSVSKRLFAEVNLDSPIEENVLPVIFENHSRVGLTLQGIVEQSLTIN